MSSDRGSDDGKNTPPPAAEGGQPPAPSGAEVAAEGGAEVPEAPALPAAGTPTQPLPHPQAKPPAEAEAPAVDPRDAHAAAVVTRQLAGRPAVPEEVRGRAAAVKAVGKIIPLERLDWDETRAHGQIRTLAADRVRQVEASLRLSPLKAPATVTVVPADAAGVSALSCGSLCCLTESCTRAHNLRATARSGCGSRCVWVFPSGGGRTLSTDTPSWNAPWRVLFRGTIVLTVF